WDGHAEIQPPEIDWADNPVGSYVRKFDLAPGLRNRRVCISFQGVEQAFYVWLNGHFVGYAEDSFTPSDFDLTEFLRPERNRLCVEVYKRSSAAWLEDQDMFRFSGIFRSVFLYAKPAVHLQDLWLQAGLCEDNTTGTLTVRLRLEGDAGGAAVLARIEGNGRVLYDAPLALAARDGFLYSPPLTFADIRPWCHEDPALYQVTLTLQNAAGQVMEVIPYRIGFRRLAMVDGVVRLNGQRLVIRGVNRHEWNPSRGRAVTMADMTAAMETFRRNHINAVRTCHYPNQTPWYDLCDENGIYMMDEANLESHGSWQKGGAVEPSWNVPGDKPEWRDCVVDRARSMFERDKNHPAILFWSCGNESYAGADILAMSQFFHQNDPGRLVHYEGVFHNRVWDAISDVESRMYATPEDIRAYLGQAPAKPFLLCEYMHDMGNSLGGMESYIRLGEEFAQYQGGFIWDYMDQALWHTDALGRRVLGYGGDFDDRQSDYNFSGNGIVFADGTEKPAMQEVRYWYDTPARRAAHDAANTAARAEARTALEALRREGDALAAAAPALRVTHGDGALGVRGDGFEVLFSYSEGGPVSLRRGGREWLWRAPRLALWRAPTENDMGGGFARRSSVWLAADSWQQCTGWELLAEEERRVTVRYTFGFPAVPGLTARVCYTVDAAGRLLAQADCTPSADLPELPLFGLRFQTAAPVETVEWLGLSGETYPDRRRGGVFGAHSEAPHVPAYLVPQECGCHVDTHAAALRLADGSRLHLRMADRPFAFSALPCTPQQLEAAAHREELPCVSRTVVTVCGAMRGVGGIDSWGADVEPTYRLPAGQPLHLAVELTAQT
ncbi:MAG: glycoside hydrolase family 2 TIM barrel-domain containing protein, partial [Gemmiger sp.]